MFPKSIAVPKPSLISPCFPTVLSVLSRSQSLYVLHFLSMLFLDSLKPVCVLVFPPHAQTAGQESSTWGGWLRAIEVVTCYLILVTVQ